MEELRMKLYIGNLSYQTTDADLRQAFQAHGEVLSARVIIDKMTNRSRGFGFVEMNDADGQTAIKAMDGASLQGRQLKVNEAKPQEGGGGRGRPRY